jgi:hypothetical protein
MKILVSHNPEEEHNVATNGELVMFSLYQKSEDSSMIGITSGLFTHFVKVEYLKIDKDLIYSILKEVVEERYKAKFKGENEFEVMSYFRYDLNEIVDELIEQASKFEVGDILEVEGKELKKVSIIEEQEEEILMINKKTLISKLEDEYALQINPSPEVDAYNWGLKKAIDIIKGL